MSHICPDCGATLMVGKSLSDDFTPLKCYTGTSIPGIGTSKRRCEYEGFLRKNGEIVDKTINGKRCQANPEPKQPEIRTEIPATASEIGDRDIDYRQSGDAVEIRYRGKWHLIGKVRNGEYTKFENKNGLHQKTNSFGIPYSFLKWLENRKIKYMKIWFEGIHYDTTVQNWREKGTFLYFKGRSEKRIHLNRKDF